MDLVGKKVVITGASRGIGRALAEVFTKASAEVHQVVRQSSPQSEALANKSKGLVWTVDLSEAAHIEPFVKDFIQKKGVPDILINNAGLLTGGLLEQQKSTEIAQMMSVNLTNLILLTKELLPHFLKEKKGVIVNNASVSARMYFPCASTYAASKAGVMAFTECMKQELRGTGVRTLLLLTPGVKTSMYDNIKNLYGENLDLSFLSYQSAESWAQEVLEAVKEEREELEPKSWNKMGLRVAHHFPALFEKIVAKKFHRK